MGRVGYDHTTFSSHPERSWAPMQYEGIAPEAAASLQQIANKDWVRRMGRRRALIENIVTRIPGGQLWGFRPMFRRQLFHRGNIVWLAEVNMQLGAVRWIGKQTWRVIKWEWDLVFEENGVWYKDGPYDDPGPEFH